MQPHVSLNQSPAPLIGKTFRVRPQSARLTLTGTEYRRSISRRGNHVDRMRLKRLEITAAGPAGGCVRGLVRVTQDADIRQIRPSFQPDPFVSGWPSIQTSYQAQDVFNINTLITTLQDGEGYTLEGITCCTRKRIVNQNYRHSIIDTS